MPFIAFLGCDGCGKSTVMDRIEQELLSKGIDVTRGHWVPGPPNENAGNSADDPHGKPPRGLPASIAKLAYLGVRWWAGWFCGLRRKSRDGILLFDRYHADLLVDPRRYRYGGPRWLAKFILTCLPQPDLVIFLDAPADVLLARKQEVSLETLECSIRNYQALGRRTSGFRVIDATQPIEGVVNSVLSEMKPLIPEI